MCDKVSMQYVDLDGELHVQLMVDGYMMAYRCFDIDLIKSKPLNKTFCVLVDGEAVNANFDIYWDEQLSMCQIK